MKRFLVAFLVLVFWQALDLRLQQSVVSERKPLALNCVLELDEWLELDSPAWDESGDSGSGDEDVSFSPPLTGLFPDNFLAVNSGFLSSETSRWRNCAAEKGSKVPLFLLYHYLKGY